MYLSCLYTVFAFFCRKIIDNVRGEINKRQWIIFDGDVDPEWVENLNSVLDDNKLLTLPNGERLSLPPNVRVMFEVSSWHCMDVSHYNYVQLQYSFISTVFMGSIKV